MNAEVGRELEKVLDTQMLCLKHMSDTLRFVEKSLFTPTVPTVTKMEEDDDTDYEAEADEFDMKTAQARKEARNDAIYDRERERRAGI